MIDDVDRGNTDEDAEIYALAGQLLGTVWVVDGVPREVLRIKQKTTRTEGVSMSRPVMVMSGGESYAVTQFRSEILQEEVEPTGDLVSQYVARSVKGGGESA